MKTHPQPQKAQSDPKPLPKPLEAWRQDEHDSDLWHGKNGTIINTAALIEREFFFDVVRVLTDDTVAYHTEAPSAVEGGASLSLRDQPGT